jgi:hypothetical protein
VLETLCFFSSLEIDGFSLHPLGANLLSFATFSPFQSNKTNSNSKPFSFLFLLLLCMCLDDVKNCQKNKNTNSFVI